MNPPRIVYDVNVLKMTPLHYLDLVQNSLATFSLNTNEEEKYGKLLVLHFLLSTVSEKTEKTNPATKRFS